MYVDKQERLTGLFEAVLNVLDPQPTREGLEDTPERAAKAWLDYTKGYQQDPADILKAFEDGADGYTGMVVVKRIPFYSHCEHHLAPIFGNVSVGYIPNGRIIGLSKMPRLVEVFARRLQVQERLTTQIAAAMYDHFNPAFVGVHVEARHFCMEARGVCKPGETTTRMFRFMPGMGTEAKAAMVSEFNFNLKG